VSLKHALLGILTISPMTGYQLKQFFDASVQHIWNAELSQIYPTLKQMEAERLVRKTVEIQDARPNRKVYHITPEGRAELRRWMRESPPATSIRDPFLIRVFFGTEVPPEDLLILLRRQMEEHQKLLAFSDTVLRQRIRKGVEELGNKRAGLFWSLTLDLAMRYRKAYIEWCENAIEAIERGEFEAPPAEGVPDPFVERHLEADAARESP
jgi:PadR family transcriptional regulator AphA